MEHANDNILSPFGLRRLTTLEYEELIKKAQQQIEKI